MSGLVKAKEYDWKDSNMALFGSDTDRQVKKESAETEPAWNGAGQSVGIQIWRIVKFKVTHWPKEDYGRFFNGDSYIILNTYKEPESDELLYDVHFWIGKKSTQDEYGTAAYKTVELDTLLDDKPVQHREVEGHESELFKSYFKSFTTMEGGADTGFRHVEPKEYKPRLSLVKKVKKQVIVSEIPLSRKKLNDEDVFILDLGLTIYQYNGENCSKDEKFKATQYIQNIKSERGKARSETLDAGTIGLAHPFFENLTDDDVEESVDEEDGEEFQPSIFRLSNESGRLEFSEVSVGKLDKSLLDPSDVFIIDTGKECFVWTGRKANEEERKNGLAYAHNYLQKTKHPLVSVSCIKDGSKQCKRFEGIF